MAKEFTEIKAPKSPKTIYEFIEILYYENNKNEKIFNNFVTEMNSRLKNLEETFSEMDKIYEKFIERMDLHEAKKTGYIEETIKLKEEVVQLKEEVVQLKEENLSLKVQIKNLWKLFTSFLEKKITSTRENWASFFSKNKDPSISPLLEEGNNSNPSL